MEISAQGESSVWQSAKPTSEEEPVHMSQKMDNQKCEKNACEREVKTHPNHRAE